MDYVGIGFYVLNLVYTVSLTIINRERTSNINFEDIVDAFASLSDRWIGLI